MSYVPDFLLFASGFALAAAIFVWGHGRDPRWWAFLNFGIAVVDMTLAVILRSM
jgi:hypothetical protein